MPGSTTILLVDDDDAVRRLVRRVLLGEGYDVLDAATPRQALRLLGSFPGAVDLLLTDVTMPELDGFELAARVLRRRPGLPVVFMSGGSVPASARSIPGPLLEKPFALGELLALVRDALAERRAA